MAFIITLASALAILVTIGINYWVTGRNEARFTSLDDAVSEVMAEDPSFQLDAGALAADRDAALLKGRDGMLYLVRAAADKFVTRALLPGTYEAVTSGNHIKIKFHKDTADPAGLVFIDSAVAANWSGQLSPAGAHT